MSERKDRLQFYIDPEANRQLDIVSENLGISKAALIREGVDKVLKEKLPLKDDPAYKLIGLIEERGKKEDVARDHDYYLYGEGRSKNE
ncbi:MAG: ribbon-helix-helix domain-containing protein [Bacillota bacterium]